VSTRAVASAWRRQVSVYGPAFAFASAGLGDVAQRSAELASLLFRAAAAAAGVGATLLAAAIARRKAYAAAFVGWNPLVAISFAGGGHNDAWMLVLMLGSLSLVARRRDAAGGAPLDPRGGGQGARARDPPAAARAFASRRLDRRRARRPRRGRARNCVVRDRLDGDRRPGRPAAVALQPAGATRAARGPRERSPRARTRLVPAARHRRQSSALPAAADAVRIPQVASTGGCSIRVAAQRPARGNRRRARSRSAALTQVRAA
jgi:hypothetical protein